MTSATIPAGPETAAPAGTLTELDDRTGEFTAVVAVTGVVDDVQDVIDVGAFTESLRRRTPKGVHSHDWSRPIARATDVTELRPGDPRLPERTPDGSPWPHAAGALLVHGQFLDTRDGREAAAVARAFGPQQQFSIGYKVPPGGAQHRGGVRHIKSLDLYEFSTVLVGANSLAGLQSVKAFVPDGVEIKSAGTAFRTGGDPVAAATCAACGRPGPAALGLDAPGTPDVLLYCSDCTARLDEFLAGRAGDDTGTDSIADPLECALCGEPAGAAVGVLGGRDGILCPECVAAIRQWAGEVAAAGTDGELPTTVEEYTEALRHQQELDITADADLVPRRADVLPGWRPAAGGRRRP